MGVRDSSGGLSSPGFNGVSRMNTQANLDAIRERIGGKPVGRFRAVAMAGTAGLGIAALIYRVLRDTDDQG
jgi:hypothetical protein